MGGEVTVNCEPVIEQRILWQLHRLLEVKDAERGLGILVYFVLGGSLVELLLL